MVLSMIGPATCVSRAASLFQPVTRPCFPDRSRTGLCREFAMSSVHQRFFHVSHAVLFAVALFGAILVQPCMASDSVDPRIYSGAALRFKADKGIFTTVPDHQVDARIFSPISNLSENAIPNHGWDQLRPRHDI